MKLSTAAAVIVVTAGMVGAGNSVAQAATTTCSKTIKNRNVAAVVVPAGRTCRLLGVTVARSVSVQPGARLVAARTTVRGSVDARPRTKVSFDRSTIKGKVVAFYSDSVTLKRTVLAGDLRSNGRPGGLGYDGQMPNFKPMTLKVITGSRINGSLDLHGTRLGISRSTVRGGIAGGWNHAMSIRGSRISGGIDLANFREGTITMCGNTVSGDVDLSRGSYGAFLGQTVTRGLACGGNAFRGALTVNEMLGVRAADNTVSGLASGTNPAYMGPTGVIGSGNRFRGGAQGDFALASLSN